LHFTIDKEVGAFRVNANPTLKGQKMSSGTSNELDQPVIAHLPTRSNEKAETYLRRMISGVPVGMFLRFDLKFLTDMLNVWAKNSVEECPSKQKIYQIARQIKYSSKQTPSRPEFLAYWISLDSRALPTSLVE
jgi:hypothetical protein